MTRTESACLKSLGEAYAQKKLDLHLAKYMAAMAEKRFVDYLQEIADRDDPPTVRPVDPEPKIDYLEEVVDFKFSDQAKILAETVPAADVILDGKG